MLRFRNYVLPLVPIPIKNIIMNMSFHGNQILDILAILVLIKVLLTFQMEQNGTFLENSKYDYWILHKKLFSDETFTIIHISQNMES